MSVSMPPSGSTSPLAFPGAILAGRYRLEEVVGHGGMGSVWRATHTGLGEEVAVKLVSAHFVRSSDALRRFDNEAKSAAKLRSRHVPQVFDNGVLEDGTPFLVMELLRGESLSARVNRLGPIPLRETISILDQCARALARAHSLGIVHRDIKPENVYLAQSVDDDGYVVKVLDFGIAKVTSALNDDGRSSTRTGTLLGTPLYMSPEQARGLRSIDFRTDVYSLGLVAYTMLTGRLPFSGETLGELLLQICAEPLPRLRAIVPGLPPAVEDWFQKACARLPEDRYPSALVFVEALRVAAGISAVGQSDPNAGALPYSPSASASSPDDMNRQPFAAPGGVLPAPSTTSGTTVGTPSPTGARGRRVLVAAAAVVGLAVVPTIAFLVHARSAAVSAPAPQVATPSSSPAASPTAPPESEAGAAARLVSPAGEAPAASSPGVPGLREAVAAPAKPPLPPAHAAVRPATNTTPSMPTGAPSPTRKPTGAIDLGY